MAVVTGKGVQGPSSSVEFAFVCAPVRCPRVSTRITKLGKSQPRTRHTREPDPTSRNWACEKNVSCQEHVSSFREQLAAFGSCNHGVA